MGLLSSTFSSNVKRISFKLFLYLTSLWVICYIAYLALNYMYFNSRGGNSGAQINHVLQTNFDAYIFGASRASHHYDPSIINEELGLQCFNAGDDGKNANYQLGLLKMLLKRHIPQLIIYEIGDLSASLDAGSVDLFPYYYRDHDIKRLLIRRDPWARLKFLLPLYAYNRKVFTVAKGYILSVPPFESGFRPLKGTMHPKEIERLENVNSSNNVAVQIDSLALGSFVEFINVCKQANIELVFCYSPTFLPVEVPGINKIRPIAVTHNIPMFVYSRNPAFNKQPHLFKDSGHLNSIGAEQFTKLFIKDMHDRGLFPVHQGQVKGIPTKK